MKFFKTIVPSLVLLLIFCAPSFAQTPGTGCHIGNEVAANYLGTATYYGNTNVIVKVYRDNFKIPIITGNGYAGYKCGYINVYSAGVRNGGTQPHPGAQEIVNNYSGNASRKCVVVSAYTPNVTSASGEGFEVDYKYNDPAFANYRDTSFPCPTTPTVPVPLDDYIPLFMIIIAGMSFVLIRKNLAFSQDRLTNL